MTNINVIGLDLAKNVFQLHGVDEQGEIVLQKQLKRAQMLGFFANLNPCLIGIEACGGMHYWARELGRLGHTVRAMAPAFVKPYLKSNKTDRNDAQAICEAVQRPSMRFVDIKSADQQAVLHLHHARRLLVSQRVALGNHIRGVLSEYGIVMPTGVKAFSRVLVIAHDEKNELPQITRELVVELKGEYDALVQRTQVLHKRIDHWHQTNETSQLLSSIPGVGVLTASALTAHLGQASSFRNGRQLAAYLGLVPRQASSGGKHRLLGISKRGDGYLRYLLIQGAKTVIRHVKRRMAMGQPTQMPWLEKLLQRTHPNKAAVALANKMARISWVLVTRKQIYQAPCING